MPSHPVESVAAGSVAERAGIRPGDRLRSINGESIRDQIDYLALSQKSSLRLVWETDDGSSTALIRKRKDEPLGLTFGESMRLKPKRCANRCVFCFVDQLPDGMRLSLYIKDDDWRMSLIMGNYVTLTNLSDAEFERLLRRRASPLYLSVHTLNPELRARMLGCSRGGELDARLRALCERGIRFHAQIVMCPDWNDGAALDETIAGLLSYIPNAQSVAVVPVGLTRHRAGLDALRPVDRETARRTLDQIRRWQRVSRERTGSSFVFAADELYIKAGEQIPNDAEYEDYPQIENGVGLLRRFAMEYEEAWREGNRCAATDRTPQRRRVIVATGVDAAPFLRELIGRFPVFADVTVRAVVNRFFGETITVAGLLTGRDLAEQLADVSADEILIPGSALNADGLFLDDWTLKRLRDELSVPVRTVGSSGESLYACLCGSDEPIIGG
ncbi:MAG: DUF512 domain-containing protein [Oscillospiraceae bacterium]|jgi:putative radical SAM enzyme (TIGR03279 family)|nr:DUF512 domain-containing protein [Oscillospiraceae bacterium]